MTPFMRSLKFLTIIILLGTFVASGAIMGFWVDDTPNILITISSLLALLSFSYVLIGKGKFIKPAIIIAYISIIITIIIGFIMISESNVVANSAFNSDLRPITTVLQPFTLINEDRVISQIPINLELGIAPLDVAQVWILLFNGIALISATAILAITGKLQEIEAVRKWLVALKRRPQNIPFVIMIISMVVYTFNLTYHSDAAMYVSNEIIAFYVFLTTLLSMLTVFSFTNIFARRQKFKGVWLSAMYLFSVAQVFLSTLYIIILYHEAVLRTTPVPLIDSILNSADATIAHIITMSLAIIVMVIMPIYSNWLLKIDTSIEDAELIDVYGDEEIELAEE